ncbi:response regulator [Szabonella alba]|uniref:Response regulator n=1 Tax=Szabonella alba TaxID=2804194 RepID=A0A8K0VEX5_9RHOB|nr:response regulator [Szabonella alba]MBL4919003.1 response regulator [Szabonella alba]
MNGKSVLVVDDDTQVREHVSELLRSMGYNVRTASNASDALSLLEQEEQPDLMLTDIMMPGGMNGRNLADEAGIRFPDLPVIFMSGYADSSLLVDGTIRQNENFLAKPFRRRQLSDIVELALSRPLRH